MAALGASCAIAMIGVLGVVASGGVRAAEYRRALAQEPVDAGGRAASVFVVENLVDLDGHPVSVAVVSARDLGRAVPPGIPRLPAAGEVYLSPQLVDDCAMPARCPFAERRAGVIGRAGLVNPRQRLAYVGVARARLGPNGGDASTSFGAAPTTGRAQHGIADAGFALFVLLPLAGLVAVSARWGARRNARRAFTWRVLGATRFQATADQVVRAVGAAAIGVAVGATAYLVAAPHVTRLPMVDRPVDPDDLRLGWRTIAVAAGVLLVFIAVTSAAAAVRGADLSLRVTRRRYARVAPTVLAAGTAIIVWQCASLIGSRRSSAMRPVLEVGLVLFGLGLSSGLAPLVARFGNAVASRSGPAGLTAGRRLRDDPAPATRASAAIALGCFVACIAATVTSVFAPLIASTATLTRSTTLFATRDAPRAYLSARGLPAGVRIAVPEVPLFGARGEIGRALVASCDQLEAVFGVPARHCTGKPQWLRLTPGPSPAPPTATYLRRTDGNPVPLAVDAKPATMKFVSALPFYDTTAVVPPTSVAVTGGGLMTSRLVGRVDSSWEAFRDLKIAVVRQDPTADVELPSMAKDSLSGVFSWLLLGVLLAGSISAITVLIAFKDIADQQLRAHALLTVSGGTPATVVRSHLTFVALPATINVLFAVVIGFVASLAYAGSARFLPPIAAFAVIGVAGVAICVVAALTSAPRRIAPADLARAVRAE